jgi:pyrroloquinoline quinone biosynthesis protein B
MPHVAVLGTSQDGGVPHAGCLCQNCHAARSDWRHRRLPVALGIVSGNQSVLVDATSAFEEQMHALWKELPASSSHSSERYPPPGQMILTHAHTGHYVGLWQLDRSVLAADGVRVTGPPATIDLLRNNEPWAQMSREGFLRFEPVRFVEPFEPVPDVRVTLIAVPHRSEWSTDTAALRIEGPAGSLLYIPDIDSWDDWDRDLVDMSSSVDVALLDGCFWRAPSRSGVPHPPILETMERLQSLVESKRARVVFTHLNHSNPAVTPGSTESEEIERRGFGVAREGDRFDI